MKYFKISELAKKFDITRTTLIHYDHYGLLIPSFRNDKSYRFYTEKDVKKLELILALKESGLSLSEIKDYMANKTDKSGLDLLMTQRKEIDIKIKDLRNKRNIIDIKIKHLKKFSSLEVYEGILIDVYGEMDLIVEPIGFGPLMNYESAVNRLKKKLSHDSPLTSKYGMVYNIKDIKQPQMIYVSDYLSNKTDDHKILHIKPRKYIRTLHYGHHETINETLLKLDTYAQEHNLVLDTTAFFVPYLTTGNLIRMNTSQRF